MPLLGTEDVDCSDDILLKKWAGQRDAGAFNELTRRYADMVYATCYRILANPADAEEVAQECFIELAGRRLRIRASLAGWLHRLATHRSIDRIRADRRREKREKQYMEQAKCSGEATWSDVRGYVDEAIAELPENLRDPLVRHFLQRQTQESIALSLGITRQAVAQRIGRGVERIRTYLERRGVLVPTAVLAGMLITETVKAAPLSLTTDLAKLAIAGVGKPLAVGAAGSTVLGTAKLTAGVAIMWKHVVLAATAIGFGLGLVYVFTTGQSEQPVSLRQHRNSDSSAVEGVMPFHAALPEAPSGQETSVDPSQAEALSFADDSKKAQLTAVFEQLLKSYQNELASEPSQGDNAWPDPLTSDEISLENGAHYFLLAAELFPNVDREWLVEQFDKLRKNGWVEDPALRAFLDDCHEAFDAVRKGLEVGNAMMPLMRGFDEPMPYLTTFRDLARAMTIEAQMYRAEGDYGAAFDTSATLFDFANESSRGGALINGLVGYGVNGIAGASLCDMLACGGASPEHYRFVIERLQAAEARAYGMAEAASSEIENIQNWLENGRANGADLRTILGNPQGALATMTEADLEVLVHEVLQAYGRSIDYLALPFYLARDIDSQVVSGANMAQGDLLPSFDNLQAAEAASSAWRRGTLLVAALELYRLETGRYPTSLQALVPTYLPALPEDPFTGRSFLYRTSQGGYTLYSTGADMQDNGGTHGQWREEGTDRLFPIPPGG